MVLVTGGAGYIGTHTLVELDSANLEFVVYDNLSNSSKKAIDRVSQIINKDILFEKGDIRDKNRLTEVFKKHKIDSVIHFAGLKAVGESVKNPLIYYDNNVNGTLVLLKIMEEFDCKNIVFSSSATVYGDSKVMPLKENFNVGNTTNPYGSSKYMIERILQDVSIGDDRFRCVILRYFNPVGAHKSGLIGEDPNGIPNNLMPYISQVAVGKLDVLNIFGNDYDTKDGTGVRDFIHVVDLADAHVKAIKYIYSQDFDKNKTIFNIGTGKGYSVLELVDAFEKASNKKINYKFAKRREGDIAVCYADASLAKNILSWSATKDIFDMCKDSWNWQSKNQNGYNSK